MSSHELRNGELWPVRSGAGGSVILPRSAGHHLVPALNHPKGPRNRIR